MPGGTGNFEIFGDETCLDNSDVGFFAAGADGLYHMFVSIDGLIFKVLGVGDTLDGRTVTNIAAGGRWLDDDQAVFQARFAPNDVGIYVASVCEPGPVPGDMNGDGAVTLEDVTIMVDFLVSPHGKPASQVCAADVNLDHWADGLDIQPFVELLLGA